MAATYKRALAVLVAVSAISCGPERTSSDYLAFTDAHDAMRSGMSLPQVFDAGLADYLIKLGGKNVAGSTVPGKEPVSAECRRHVLDVHYGGGDIGSSGGFSVRVYCNMNGPSDPQVTPQGVFQTKADLVQGLDTFSAWAKAMTFRVESPSVKMGGVFDSYQFTIDENGRVTTVSEVRLAN